MSRERLIEESHLQRKALVYVRQSTPGQVLENRESTRLQYQLRDVALELGWGSGRIETIDEDLGVSGSGEVQRGGFERLNRFHREVLSPYLNYHRPCYFPHEQIDAKGKLRKRYRQQDLLTPYEKLKLLPGAEACLRPGIDFAQLDAEAHELSDNEAAQRLNEARDKLFAEIRGGTGECGLRGTSLQAHVTLETAPCPPRPARKRRGPWRDSSRRAFQHTPWHTAAGAACGAPAGVGSNPQRASLSNFGMIRSGARRGIGGYGSRGASGRAGWKPALVPEGVFKKPSEGCKLRGLCPRSLTVAPPGFLEAWNTPKMGSGRRRQGRHPHDISVMLPPYS